MESPRDTPLFCNEDFRSTMHKLLPWIYACLALSFSACAQPQAQDDAGRRTFGVLYTAWIKPETEGATVRIRLTRHPEWVDWMRFRADAEKYSGVEGSGTIEEKDGRILWTPPQEDAWIQYRVKLSRQRSDGTYDRYVTKDWALFRADDLVPRVHSSMEDGTRSESKLRVHLPDGWSIATPYRQYDSGRYAIDDPDRLLDQPAGWMLAGRIGTRRDIIGGTRVTVAAPLNQGVRRLDMLAFLRWTLPTLQQVFPEFPERLLIVSAGKPMWRGALSGPASLYLHADRPMISENATSTLVHELVHVAMRARGGPRADWIVEGLAEYYSLEVLRRSDAISSKRFKAAHADLARWGKKAPELEVEQSKGPVTARAVGVMREIDADIRAASDGKRSLDDVVRELARDDKAITRERFEALVEQMKR